MTGGTIIYFGTEDCTAEESCVSDAGGKVVQPKMSIGEFGWVSVCMDTEGNMKRSDTINVDFKATH